MLKLVKRLMHMGKDVGRKRGRSSRNGNAPSPYQKYGKVPYKYSSAYHDWRRDRLAGKAPAAVRDDKFKYQEYKEAAE